jgi:IS30 family transposase
MPKGYQHLTYEQRCQIYALKKSGFSQNATAKQLGVSQSTISKELPRNSGGNGYRYKHAHEKAKERRYKASSVATKMTPDFIPLMKQFICKKKMSPEQISGRLRKTQGVEISYESIYRYIWNDKKAGGDLYKNLRQRGKRRNKRGSKKAGRGLIPGRIGIEERPEIVDSKGRVGDWEGDTIIGKDHRGAIVSMVEPKTKLVRLQLLTGANVTKALDSKIYFANPYRSWERGLNEYTNILVRQFLPKKTDFTILTHEEIRQIEENLNNRPRKKLNFNTPNEEFLRLTNMVPSYALHC